jgi:hypothetical protein
MSENKTDHENAWTKTGESGWGTENILHTYI